MENRFIPHPERLPDEEAEKIKVEAGELAPEAPLETESTIEAAQEQVSEPITPEVQEQSKEDLHAEVIELEDKKGKEQEALKGAREKLGLPTEETDLESAATESW